MELKLNRPICFFDLETTGIDIGKDRIVEIAILKVYIVVTLTLIHIQFLLLILQPDLRLVALHQEQLVICLGQQ